MGQQQSAVVGSGQAEGALMMTTDETDTTHRQPQPYRLPDTQGIVPSNGLSGPITQEHGPPPPITQEHRPPRPIFQESGVPAFCLDQIAAKLERLRAEPDNRAAWLIVHGLSAAAAAHCGTARAEGAGQCLMADPALPPLRTIAEPATDVSNDMRVGDALDHDALAHDVSGDDVSGDDVPFSINFAAHEVDPDSLRLELERELFAEQASQAILTAPQTDSDSASGTDDDSDSRWGTVIPFPGPRHSQPRHSQPPHSTTPAHTSTPAPGDHL